MQSSFKYAAMAASMLVYASVVDAQTATFVQVNVNALGQNIIGDAANEPSIAVDPTNPNRMAIGWRQFDTINSNFREAGVAYTTDGGQTWTAGVLVQNQFRSDPVLRADADGNFYYSSLQGNLSIDVFKSTNGGQTWGPPVPAFGGDKQWIAIDTTNGPGVIAVNQLMAQSNAPKAPAVVASNTPATRPARVGAATPKDALRALAVAGGAADVEAIKVLVDVKDPRSEQLLVAACEYATTRKTFFETVETKFGEPALTRLSGMMRVSTFDVFLRDLETRTDTLAEQIQGNEATFATERSEYGDIHMVRDDAGWKLSATNMTKDWPQEQYTRVLTGVQQGNVALGNLTNDMNDGKIAEFPDLMRSVRGVMSELRNK